MFKKQFIKLDWAELIGLNLAFTPPYVAHRACGSSDGAEKELSNPMVKLFYGQYLAEGINEGKVFYFLFVPAAHISQCFPLSVLHLFWG